MHRTPINTTKDIPMTEEQSEYEIWRETVATGEQYMLFPSPSLEEARLLRDELNQEEEWKASLFPGGENTHRFLVVEVKSVKSEVT
jgi:hypothetical protein